MSSSSAGGGDTAETVAQLREQLRQETERANRERDEAKRANRERERETERANRERDEATRANRERERETERANREAERATRERERATREAEERAPRETERAKAATREATRIMSIYYGTYSATLPDVWGVQIEAIKEGDSRTFNILMRESSPNFLERRRASSDQQGPQQGQYEMTRKSAFEVTTEVPLQGTNVTVPLPLLVPANSKGDSQKSSESTSNKKQIWPTDIFGQIDPIAKNVHLVPASASNASIFTDVARWVFAIRKSEADTDELILQKLIHGSKKPNDGPTGRSSRVSHTGLKHCVANKIRLHGQGTYCDRYPCVLIVPVLTLEEAKQWNGEGYTAIVPAGPYDMASAANAYRSIQINDGDEAEDDQIETGRVFLSQLVLGMMYSVKFRHETLERGLDNETKTRQQALRDAIPENSIKIPQRKIVSGQQNNFHIRMVQFASHDETAGHPAPDPLLLGVKASINWSWSNSQKMMAEEPPELSEDDLLDLQAEEEFLEWRAHTCKWNVETRKLLACLLGNVTLVGQVPMSSPTANKNCRSMGYFYSMMWFRKGWTLMQTLLVDCHVGRLRNT